MAEQANAPLTCRSIITNTIHIGVEEEDRLATWMGDAEACFSGANPSGLKAQVTVLISVFI